MSKYIKLFKNHTQYETYASGEMILPNVSHCIDVNDVHYNPIPDPYNGHAYVDLGLPSGTQWATMNVGASSEKEAGLYFAWGETQGYTASKVGTDKNFSWSDYALTEDSGSTFTKYNSSDGKTVLDLEDDAAHVNMGGDWHMPTKEQCDELFNTAYVTNDWVTDYNGSGVNGRLFTSVSNGKTMFVPAAGFCVGGEVGDVGNFGYVWASALYSESVKNAWYFFFNSDEAGVYGLSRCYGQSVRGVISPTVTPPIEEEPIFNPQ